ncbi:T9SS type A sorting domain-containing protein, partial [Eudoraea sp.]|uniref:T9SS type A sorting domain-containing protein n=1 Tax=Eudoraea sp. TaxID=1979955 RepID=UPI003C728694
LNVGQLTSGGIITLIVKHSNGNDVAFASDETAQAPELIITSGSIGALGAKSVNTLILSPNPASSEVAIGFKLPTRMSAIFVYDMTGKLLQTIPAGEAGSVEDYQMKVSGLPTCIYLIRTFDAFGVPHQKKMLIKR